MSKVTWSRTYYRFALLGEGCAPLDDHGNLASETQMPTICSAPVNEQITEAAYWQGRGFARIRVTIEVLEDKI